MQIEDTCEVAIVGFGPVGATLAALLGGRGRRVAVFDRSTDIYPLPRAFALDQEAMRTMQEVGIADALAPHVMAYRPTLYIGADGEPIQHFDMGPGPYPLAWAPTYTFNQPALETELRRAVGTLPGVAVHLGHEVTDVQQPTGEDGALLTVQAPDGSARNVHARYVVACDGGTSPMRKRLGLTLRSLEFDEPWVVVDVRVNDDMLGSLPATNIQYCRPERPCTYVVGPGVHRRWEFLLTAEEAARREMPDEAIWQLLAPWLRPDQAQLWRAATYRFHAVVLQRWRSGHVLLAGDAAHQMPPFLAQGMCQGLRDAANLAWKLDRVLAGQSGDALLDSYGEERGPQVEEVTATVKRLGQIICERDPARARVRDQRLRDEQGGQVKMQLRQNLLPGIRHGLIDGGTAPAGMPFPQARCLTDGTDVLRRMDDLLGRGFVLVLKSAPDAAQWQAWADALRTLGAQAVCVGDQPPTPQLLRLTEAEPVLAHWFAHHCCEAALVRPDHVVYGVAARSEDVGTLLNKACRQLPASTAQPHCH